MMEEDDIVITGFSAYFPQADHLVEFKEKLYAGIDFVTEDDARWPRGFLGLPERKGTIRDLSRFDAQFFGVNPKQAQLMDPQMRLLLETSYEAIVDAGYDPTTMRGRNVGVFIGCSDSESEGAIGGDAENVDSYVLLGNNRAIFANRISYSFDFNGPSVAVETACSSTLVALNDAMMAIRTGQCEAAIVGGSLITLKPTKSLVYLNLGMLGPDGRCKSFDSRSNGYARSETVGVFFIQRAREARRVYARVVHVKSNADGYKSGGLTVPSTKLQAKLLREVYAEANIDPLQVHYVEAHGTGTKIGDPHELAALSSVFCQQGRKRPLKVGSIKSNLGHSETASGVCSVAKVILAMETGIIAGNLHFNEANPDIPSLLDGSVEVVDKATPFAGGPVGINSFGFGGSNAHAILEANPGSQVDSIVREKPELPRLVLAAGRSQESLMRTMDRMEAEGPYPDSAYALLNFVGQPSVMQFPFRGFMLLPVDGSDKQVVKIVEPAAVKERPLWFIFTGFGCQWRGMARQMMQFDVFARSLEKSHQVLTQFSIDLIGEATSENNYSDAMSSVFASITAIQVALVDVLFAVGLRPDGIVGHSLGEIACAYADGCLTAEQTVMCAYWRGRCVDLGDLPKGSMAAVGLTWEEAKRRCCDGVVPACHNAVDSVTVSGSPQAVSQLVEQLRGENVFAREVEGADIAFHSEHIRKIAPPLLEALERVIPEPKPRSQRWVCSSLPESRWHEPIAQTSSAEYHVNNLLSPVLFCEALQHVPKNAVVVEIAPHCLLQAVLRRALGSEATSLGLMKRNVDNPAFFLNSLGKLHVLGVKINLSPLYPPVSMPVPRGTPSIAHLVSWDHSQSWSVAKCEDFSPSSKLSQEIAELDLGDNGPDSYLTGHQIQGRILFPAAGYIVLAWKSLAKRCGKPFYKVPVVLEDVRFHQATIIQTNGTTRFSVNIMEGSGQFEISEAGAVAASGRIRMAAENEKIIDMEPPCPNAADIASCDLDAEDVYKELRLRGCEYYGQFQGILKANIKTRNALLKWDNNWIPFIDTMLHGSCLAYPKRALKLPVKIISCRIDPVVHMEMTKKATESGVGYVYDKSLHTCRSGGIILQGLKFNTAPQRVTEDVMVLNEHAFVPHIDSESSRQRRQASLQEYIDVCSGAAQCILQSSCGQESESLAAGKCIYSASEEGQKYNLKHNAENYGLLKTLTAIQEEVNRCDSSLVQIIQSAIKTYEEELENDVIKTALFEEDPLRHLLDVVVENTSTPKLEVCELVTARRHCVPYSQFTQLLAMAKTRLKVDYTVAFPSDSDFTSVNVSEGTSLLHWNPSAVPNKKLPEADFLVACLSTWGSSQIEILAQQLSVQSKKQGFILIVLRTAVTPAEQVLMSLGCIQLQVHREEAVESLFNSYGFTIVGLKSNNFSTLLLLRNTLEEAKPAVVKVSSDNFHWIDELKAKVIEYENKPDGHTIWLIADDNDTSGVLGLANCLRRETGGRHVRCILRIGMEESKPIVDFSPDNQLYNTLLKQDLVMNVYRDGQWGSYHDTSSIFRGPQTIATELAFLNVQTRGDLSSLQWYESPLRYASPSSRSNRVLCTVYYAPLNFRDVMIATGKLPPDALPSDQADYECLLGLEFSGRDPQGRRVMGFVESQGMATVVSADTEYLLEVPETWTLEEASTVPVVYMTAYLALLVRGNMLPGESLLVHSGSGGVGQAAISIALAMGCTVFTTVGSQEKRDFLKNRFPQLQDRHIANSRDLSFEEHILRETGGRGVDLVLNSLAEAKLQASLRCLAERGRFLEIGKFDLSRDSPLGMAVFLKSTTASVVEKRRQVMKLLRDGIASGVVRPLNAVQFKSNHAEEAFRFMAAGKHMGKVVLEIRPEEAQPLAAPATPLIVKATARTRFYERKSYVIVGGLGGLGLELAEWMVNRGCRKLVLTTRSGVNTGYQRFCLQRWGEAGANVLVSKADASTLNGSQEIIKEADAMGPVGGIFNLGGVLRDALLVNQTAEAFEAVCKIKIDGTRYLDELSRTLCPELDHFVVFSSLASCRGNIGQSNYGYANSAMERICERRAAAGLPGLAIQWGPIKDVGMFLQAMYLDVESYELVPQPIASFISAMDQFLCQRRTIVSSYVKPRHSTKEDSKKKHDPAHSVARILGIKDPSSLNPDVSFGEHGMDSLMAVEVKQTLERDFDLVLSMQQIRQLTINELRTIGNTGCACNVTSRNPNTSNNEKDFVNSSNLPRLRLFEKTVHENIVVEMNGLEGSSPVFFVHPIEGHVRALTELARYLPVRAVGLQRTTDVNLRSITEMASTYLKAILKTQPSGPHHLVGYSYGTTVALEVAVQLQASGATVGSLTFLDAAPQYVRVVSGYQRDLLGQETDEQETNLLCAYLMQYVDADFSEVRDKLSQCKNFDTKLDVAINILLKAFGDEQPSRQDLAISMSTFCDCLKAGSTYEPEVKFSGNVVLVKASQAQDMARQLPPDYGLSECCDGEVDVRVVDGSHESFIFGEGAKQCADIISQQVRR
ncbi:fatty acid synthase-like [Dermacentor silvarum]|uniref:fatty acid synthase-like n=1 Tax=Dermacentor silvarum TaxID=543639 RepID=UPI0021018299|nr:fatty acid synthase-like [Dermacentor silvarum]